MFFLFIHNIFALSERMVWHLNIRIVWSILAMKCDPRLKVLPTSIYSKTHEFVPKKCERLLATKCIVTVIITIRIGLGTCTTLSTYL